MVINMDNQKGCKSKSNYLIKDNRGILYLQSYAEIVCIKKDGIVYAKEGGLDRSKSTNKYMNLFIDRYGGANYEIMRDEDFVDMESKL